MRTPRSDKAQGIYLSALSPGEVIFVRTLHHLYRLEYLGCGTARISGNAAFCPQPQLVNLLGSSWGNSYLQLGFIGEGLCLELQKPGQQTVIRTSPVREVRRPGPAVLSADISP